MKTDTATPNRKRAAKIAPRFIGAVDGLHKGLLYGWAIDTEQPDARVVVEICLNDDVIGCLIADVARSDLIGTAADPCHGFVADIGFFAPRQGGALSARVANTALRLEGSISLERDIKPPVTATSNVFSDGALRLHGWAFDSQDDKRSLTVRAFLGHTQVAEVLADQEHPSLRSHGVGRHGFTLDLPDPPGRLEFPRFLEK